MAALVYVNSGAVGANNGTSWTDAYTTLGGGLGDVDQDGTILVHTAHRETSSSADMDFAGRSADRSYDVIVVDKDNSDAYDPNGSTVNLEVTSGNYRVRLYRAVRFYGLRVKSTEEIFVTGDNDAQCALVDCTLTVGAGYSLQIGANAKFTNCKVDTQDSSNSSVALLNFQDASHGFGDGYSLVSGLTLGTGCAYRDVLYAADSAHNIRFVDGDFSPMTRNPVSLTSNSSKFLVEFHDCKPPTSWQWTSGAQDNRRRVDMVRCEGTDEMQSYDSAGEMVNEDTIVRTGGSPNSFEITTSTYCGTNNAFYTPWMLVPVDSTGVKNFDVYYTCNDRLNQEKLFIEIELMDSASQPYGKRITTQKKQYLGDTVGNHATGGTWGGTAQTYKEYIRGTATVNVANSMARVRAGIEEQSQTNEVYVDRKPEVS